MRRFVVQFLIDVAATAVTSWCSCHLFHVTYTDPTTGQDLPTGRSSTSADQPWRFLLSFGLLLAICNAVIRPVILLLTGRWLIRSFGLAAGRDRRRRHLARGAGSIPSTSRWRHPSWFWGLVATLLIIVPRARSAEAVLGVDRPHIDVSDRQRAIWRLLDRLPTPRGRRSSRTCA